jgi:predicted nucleic acid-binding protein
MKFLLDTNVVSEWSNPRPDARVTSWLDRQSPEDLAVSVMTIAEILYGIEIRPAGRNKLILWRWYEEDLMELVGERVIALDYKIIRHWSVLQTEARRIGWTRPFVDSLILTTAMVHGMTIVTRNVSDFGGFGVELFNPWADD